MRKKDMSLFGSRGASLHTKAFVVDGIAGFVGSFNFDPRSVSLNTEMGILFEHAELAREMQAVFAEETAPKRSYRVVLAGRDRLARWGGAHPRQEPDASLQAARGGDDDQPSAGRVAALTKVSRRHFCADNGTFIAGPSFPDGRVRLTLLSGKSAKVIA